MRRRNLLKKVLLGAAITVLAGAACISAAADGGDEVMTIGTPQSSATLDPVSGYDYWYTVRYGVGETLYKFDENMSPTPWLVEDDYELSDDQLTWTFHIKDNVTFSNGNPLTAEAAKGAIERAFELSTYPAIYFTYDSIEASGQDLSITTTEPVPIMQYIMADPIFVMYDTSVDLTNIASEGPVCTGPFVFSSFDAINYDTSVVRNENYWNGDVALAGINFRIIKDTSSLFMALQGGEVNAAYALDAVDLNQISSDSNYVVEASPSARTDFAFMNQNGKLSDEALRQAIMRCCDRSSYCTSLLYDMYVPGKSPLSSSLPYGYDELNDINTYDPEGAAKLLDDAGYVDTNGDGYRENPDGSDLTINLTFYTTRTEMSLLAQAMQLDCEKIGIHLELQGLEQAAAWNMLTSGEYDIVFMSISMASAGDPEGNLKMYFHSYDEANPNYNMSGYSNAEVDALFDELHTTFDIDTRTSLIKDIQQKIMDDSACFCLCYPTINFAAQSNVSGVTSHPSDYYWVSAETCFTE